MNRKKFSGIAVSIRTPAEFNIDKVLLAWKAAQSIEKFDTTRLGLYVIHINDGDAEVIQEHRLGSSKYLDTCSRIMVHNPIMLARCTNPSVSNLRKIARRTHFVAAQGDIYPFPASIRVRDRAVAAVSKFSDFDKVDKNADDTLAKFLNARGLQDLNDADGDNFDTYSSSRKRSRR